MSILKDVQVIDKAYNHFLTNISPKYSLTVAEMKILVFLNDNKDSYDLAKNISEILMIAKSHVSSSVNALIEKKYLEKIQDIKDKKKFHLKLTKNAEKIVTDIVADAAKFKETILQNISEDEINKVIDILSKLKTNATDYTNSAICQ